MKTYVELPRIDDDFVEDENGFQYEIYNRAMDIYRSVDLENWDDAYPHLKDKVESMTDDQHHRFESWYAIDAYKHIPDTARSLFKEFSMWHRRVGELNYQRYNKACRDIAWAITDRIIDELIKFLELKPDRSVTHGEAA